MRTAPRVELRARSGWLTDGWVVEAERGQHTTQRILALLQPVTEKCMRQLCSAAALSAYLNRGSMGSVRCTSLAMSSSADVFFCKRNGSHEPRSVARREPQAALTEPDLASMAR